VTKKQAADNQDTLSQSNQERYMGTYRHRRPQSCVHEACSASLCISKPLPQNGHPAETPDICPNSLGKGPLGGKAGDSSVNSRDLSKKKTPI
jgi:hypothetical protein